MTEVIDKKKIIREMIYHQDCRKTMSMQSRIRKFLHLSYEIQMTNPEHDKLVLVLKIETYNTGWSNLVKYELIKLSDNGIVFQTYPELFKVIDSDVILIDIKELHINKK